MRTLSSDIKLAISTMNQKGQWAKLFDIVVDDTTTLYFTDYPENIFYGSNTYVPYPIVVGDIAETSKPEVQTFNVAVANIDRQIAAYIESGKILGNDIKITVVFMRYE